jgi:hypothetical protein
MSKIQLIEFGGNINAETKDNLVKQFLTVTPFEYDEEYLILHLEKTVSSEIELVRFEIQDIVAVYPLSQQAKISIESKIDQRIRLEKPIFETVLPAIETEIENKEVESAISALWTICKIENSLEKYIANIGLERIFNGLEYRRKRAKANRIQNGNYWEYLIAYDRFDYYPNTTLGYFYDAGQIFAFSKGYPTFEGSGIHSFLEKFNLKDPTAKLPDIIKYLETEKQLESYVSQTTIENIKQYIVAPLYLMLRDEIRKSDDVAQTKLFKNLDYLKTFDDSFNYAVILLGAFFGFRKFYDIYYDVLNLRFYKSHNAQQIEKNAEDIPEQDTIDSKNNLPESITRNKKNEEQNLIDKPNKDKQIEKQTGEIKVEEPAEIEEISSGQIIQQDKQDGKSDTLDQYKNIIEETLTEYKEIKLADIAIEIKKRTGKTTQNRNIEKIAKQMKDIEIIKIGKAKGIRRRDVSTELFGSTELSI